MTHPKTVRAIMNPELFSVRPSDTVEDARNGIMALAISAAPVLDADLRPIGIVSLRDLSDEPRSESVVRRMSAPVEVARHDDPVAAVATRLAESKLRHLVVVDHDGRAVGMVSAADVLRSLLGMKPRHPPEFPSLAREPTLVWSDRFPLDLDVILAQAPAVPGVLEIELEDANQRSLVWVEAPEDVRSRLVNMLAMPLEQSPALRAWIDRELLHLRFRVAPLSDPTERARFVEALRRSAHPGLGG